MQIENNEFYDNISTGFGKPISLQYGVNNIVQNKIHHNQMDRDGLNEMKLTVRLRRILNMTNVR